MRADRRVPREVVWLAGIMGLAFGMRCALAKAHPFWFPDSVDYDGLARAMLERGEYVTGPGAGLVATRMPGYPLFMAGVYWVTGGSVFAVLAVQAVLGAVTVGFTYLIGRRGGVRVGLIAAGLAAVDPLSVGFSASVLTEACFTALFMAALWAALRLVETGRFYWWGVLGLLWGAAVYFRVSALWGIVLIGAWAVVMLVRRGAVRVSAERAITGGLMAVGIVMLMLLPWCVRNYRIFHTGLFRLTTLEGISLYEAVYPPADGGPQQHLIKVPAEMRDMNEAERNDEWARRGWGYVRSDPVRVMKLAVVKMGRTWSPWLNATEFTSPVVRWGMIAWSVPLFVLAIIGAWARVLPREIKGLLWMPMVYFTAVHALYLGSVRYRVPLMPVVCVFAAAGIVYLWGRVRGQRAGELTV